MLAEAERLFEGQRNWVVFFFFFDSELFLPFLFFYFYFEKGGGGGGDFVDVMANRCVLLLGLVGIRGFAFDLEGHLEIDSRCYSNLANTASLVWHAYQSLPNPSNQVNWVGTNEFLDPPLYPP